MLNGTGAGSRPVGASPTCPGPVIDVAASDAIACIHVLKFGSSILSSPAAYRTAAQEVRREIRGGAKAVVVVSAMGGTTDSLLASAREVASTAPDALVGALLATGEEASVVLLSIALMAVGVPTLGLSSWRVPIHTRGTLSDADPVAVNADAILGALASQDAVVLPGFVGLDATGAPSLLGRGGSDLTALFLGKVLGASEVRLIKDVDGIFPADPKVSPCAEALSRATWDEARRIGGGVVQDKALAYAKRHVLGFRVASLGGTGTWVGGRPVRLGVPDRARNGASRP